MKTTSPTGKTFRLDDGKTSPGKWYIFGTKSLRNLARRNCQRLVPGCNYVLEWQDVHGFGLQLTRTPGPSQR